MAVENRLGGYVKCRKTSLDYLDELRERRVREARNVHERT